MINKNKKTVLITGGAGFIGHQIIYNLLKSTDFNIVSLDRLDTSGNLNRIKEILDLNPDWDQRVSIIWHDLKSPISNFLAKQIGLQASNPDMESGSTDISFLGADLSFSINRTFNLGLNLIAQAGVNFSGVHLDRAVATPIWPEGQKYEKTVSNSEYANNPGAIVNNKLDGRGNRLLTLHQGIIQGQSQETPEEQSAFGQFVTGIGDKIKEFTGQD